MAAAPTTTRPAPLAQAEDRPPDRVDTATGRGADDHLLAAAALTAMTLEAALSFGRLFGDGSFLVPVLLAAVLAHGLALACRRYDVRTSMANALLVVTAYVGVAWLVFPHTTAYGIPWAGTVDALSTALSQASQDFRTVVAPTPVTKGFLAACVLGVIIGGYLADMAAFRLRATFEAAIPSFSLFLLSATLGTKHYEGLSVAAYLAAVLLFLAAHQAGLQGRATAWFASESRGGMTHLLQAAAGLAVVAIIAALVIGPRLPGADDAPVIAWRNKDRPGPGNRTTVSPLVDIRGRLVERSTVEVFSVRATQRSYWRLTSLDRFDGDIWSSNASYKPAKGKLPEGVPSNAPANKSVQDYQIAALSSIWLPAAYEPERIAGVKGASYNADSGSIISDQDTADGLAYRVQSQVPSLTAAQLDGAPAVAPVALRDHYLELPPGRVGPRVVQLARQISTGVQSPYRRALALQNFFRNGRYTYDLRVTPGHDEPALERFLFTTRRGYCEQFAGAYAVLARLMGLPTRVAVGFTPGEAAQDGAYLVRGLNAHAWPEVYLHGYGWVAFEPTPGRGAPGAEPYTGVPEAQASPLNPSVATTLPPVPTTQPQGPGPSPNTTVTAPPATVPSTADDTPDRVPLTFLIALLVIVLAALAWGLGVPAALRARRSGLRARARTPGERVLVAWAEAGDALARAGVPRRPAETVDEYARRAARVAALSPEVGGGLLELSRDVAAASYAADELSPEVATRADTAAERVSTTVRDAATWPRRLWWSIDPRPLLPRARERHEVTSSSRQPAA